MKKIGFPVILLTISCVLFSCTGGTTRKDMQARASGRAGEIIMVIDTLHRNTQLGTEIDQTFRKEVAGLPRPEPEFNIRYVMPEGFNGILKMAQNIIIVAVLENYSRNSERVKNYFTQNSLQRIKDEPDLYYLSKQNEWAKGQEVLFLFGRTEEELIKNITENRDKLRSHFNNVEKKRLKAALYKSKELKEVGNVMMENHQFSLRIPFGWRIEYENPESNFVWMRLPGIEVDRNIWVYYKDYYTKEVFDDVTTFRNEVTKKYIFDDKEKNDTSYVVVESLIPPITNQINFNDKFGIEAKGLWKTNNNSMGGPFISYVFVDEALNRVYYIDGFVYSPGKSQREYIRELETILWTFRTESELIPTT